MDKKGAIVIQLVGFVFLAFFIVLFLGIFLYGLSITDDAFTNLNFIIGDINSTEAYEATLQQGIKAIFDIADIGAIVLLFGMVIVMMMVGYFWGDESKKLWIAFDFLIIIGAFIIGVYLQNYFTSFVTDPNFLDPTIFSDIIPMSSTLIMRLNIYIPIVGILIMFVTYALSRRKGRAETFNELGY